MRGMAREGGKRGQVEPVVLYGGVITALAVIIAVLVMALLHRSNPNAPASTSPANFRVSSSDSQAPAPDPEGAGTERPTDSVVTVDAIRGRDGGESSVAFPGRLSGLPSGNLSSPLGRRGMVETQPSASTPGEFQAYMSWLAQAEAERQQLMKRGSATVVQLSNPATRATFRRNGQEAQIEASRETQAFVSRIRSNKPGVPVDCKELDEDYMRGVDGEIRLMMNLIGQAVTGRPARTGAAAYTAQALGSADGELVTACRNHGIQPPTRIRSGL